jgi:hypothetical protein
MCTSLFSRFFSPSYTLLGFSVISVKNARCQAMNKVRNISKVFTSSDPKRVRWAIVVVCLYTSHFYLLKNNSMYLTQTYHAVTFFIAWHLAFLTEMTENPNKVYEGGKKS